MPRQLFLAQAHGRVSAGQLPQARAILQHAITQLPSDGVLWDALGAVQFHQGDFSACIQSMRQVAQAIRSSHISTPAQADAGLSTLDQAWRNIGVCHLRLMQPNEAHQAFAQAYALAPNSVANALYHYGQNLAVCDWQGSDELREHLLQLTMQATPQDDVTASLAYFSAAQRGEQMAAISRKVAASLWAKATTQSSVPATLALHRLPLAAGWPGRKLRVGYFSCDLRQHAVGVLTQSLYALHDRQRFEVFALSYGADDASSVRATIKKGVDHFVELHGLSMVNMVQELRALNLDIVIDLGGNTAQALPQVMMHRIAPIQCHWLGYVWSMGSPAYDYVIADAFAVPPEQEAHYSEAIARLPHSLQITPSAFPVGAQPMQREQLGLREDAFVMCYFGALRKLQPELFDVWLDVLKARPNAVLWIARTPESPAQAFGRLRSRAWEAGIQPGQLVFSDPVAYGLHLRRYEVADVMLDTYPVGCGTTALESLWMGCPMVSMAQAGETLASRMSGGVLLAAGLPDLLTDSLAAYSSRLMVLATDRSVCAEYRKHLLQGRATLPIFDTQGQVRSLQQAFEQMVRQHQAQLPARTFSLAL
jgi:protein O-GlcNAc transferase